MTEKKKQSTLVIPNDFDAKKVCDIIKDILDDGDDVEIRTCKDGFKVLRVSRSSQFIISKG